MICSSFHRGGVLHKCVDYISIGEGTNFDSDVLGAPFARVARDQCCVCSHLLGWAGSYPTSQQLSGPAHHFVFALPAKDAYRDGSL
jgi:hypothetical protein